MKTIWLQINGTRYSFKQLESGDWPKNLSEFERSALSFCQDWIKGKNQFTLSTSGSTGSAKIITLLRSQMEESARLSIKALDLHPGNQALLCLDTRYIAGQMMLVRSFIAGMNVIAVEPSGNPLQSVPENEKIDFVAVVPQQLGEMTATTEGRKRTGDIRTILVGGADLSEKLKARLHDIPSSIFHSYGMTETVSHIALQRVNGPTAQNFFHTLEGITVATDQRDCLAIDAPRLVPEKVITNDIVELLSSTTFRWLGRWDRVINSGGIKVVPEKIELICSKIMEQKGVERRFFVAGLPDDRLGNIVALVVEGEPLPKEQELDLIQEIKDFVGKYETPRKVVYVPKFTETHTQKVDRLATLLLL